MTRLHDLIVDHLPELSREAQAAAPRLQTRKASTIEARDVEWIWEPWLSAGMVGLLAGYGGGGKSTVALHIAAACSVGGTLPDGQGAPLLDTLIFAAEDSPEHTIIPRLMKMGADLDRIRIVDGIAREGSEPGWIQLRNHVTAIEQAVLEHDIGLVIIDPVSSFIGDANGDKESDVRAGIMPVVAMAERTGATVLMIRHVSKAGDGTRAASRILGSTAWHDIHRVAWMLADAPDDHQPEPHGDGRQDTRRVLGVVKSNLAAKPPALWCVQPVDGPLWWLPDPSPVTVEECFISQPTRGSKGRDAEEWLQERLAGGSQPTTTVQAAAKDAGIAAATLKRARATLNVRAWKASTGEWMLSLPPRSAGGRGEGVHPEAMTDPDQEMNAFDTDEAAKALTVNALIPFPESQAKRPVQRDDERVVDDAEGGKALNSSPYTPNERLHPFEGEVWGFDPSEDVSPCVDCQAPTANRYRCDACVARAYQEST